jgi:hypothetical protein
MQKFTFQSPPSIIKRGGMVTVLYRLFNPEVSRIVDSNQILMISFNWSTSSAVQNMPSCSRYGSRMFEIEFLVRILVRSIGLLASPVGRHRYPAQTVHVARSMKIALQTSEYVCCRSASSNEASSFHIQDCACFEKRWPGVWRQALCTTADRSDSPRFDVNHPTAAKFVLRGVHVPNILWNHSKISIRMYIPTFLFRASCQN